LSRRPVPKPPAKNSVTKPPEVSDELRAEIERQIGPLVNQNQREEILVRMMSIATSEQFSGPIAHPRHLRAYEEILPGSAERIVQMAERSQEHNRSMEAKIVSAMIFENKAAMLLGFLALVLLIGLAVYCGMNGNNILAGLLLGGGFLGAATSLIRGWHKSSKPD